MNLPKQLIQSLTAGTRVVWQADQSGTCQIQADSPVTWPTSLVLDIQVGYNGIDFFVPSGFSSLQFTANGLCSPFEVRKGQFISVAVNTVSATDALIEITPNIG